MTTAIIDSHLHFWSLATPGHEWPTAQTPTLHRDFGPDDLRAAAAGTPLAGAVLVQSQPTDIDTDWMLALAAREPLVAGVVGWVDLSSPDAPLRIAALAADPKLRSLRPMLQAIDDTDWLLRDDLAPALEAMLAHGLRLDALVQPRHLPMLVRFVDRWPDLPVVIDHAAKPHAAVGTLDPWRNHIATLASQGTHCKLSGLRTEQAPGQPADELAPYVDHLVATFGERLMWGSDWPVLTWFGDTYARWIADARRLAGLSGTEQEQLFAGCARRFYALDGCDLGARTAGEHVEWSDAGNVGIRDE
ncbi:amidohydrolase family protein [Sphingomonas sp. KR1UV-12]|uniref:Amidohydrolase family protein n=1 Tax=Sphingomonas aurea TaxID=3063994 RepID=A0ABT9END5_9SPHN|nr:amidohydrolase family protein [Sphingomonas sp. KR1UV-12]MDP1028469.1 amidohydrolase family protein [Sphingomonas sp. KR1UV-12]